MKIQTESGESMVINQFNSAILDYDNDMMTGLFVDMGEQYAFISANGDAYPDIATEAVEEGVRVINIPGEVNWAEPPHCYVVQSIGNFILDTAEGVIRG